MENCNRIVRDGVTDKLQSQGFKTEFKKLKGEKYKNALYSLFLVEYKETFNKDLVSQLKVHYAEMLEIIRTLMVVTKTKIQDININKNQHIQWYQNSSPAKEKLINSRIDLLQKFDELLLCKTEATKDQLEDILSSFNQLVLAHKLSFVQVEQLRRTMFNKLGGYSKGVYLISVAKIRKQSRTQSA